MEKEICSLCNLETKSIVSICMNCGRKYKENSNADAVMDRCKLREKYIVINERINNDE